MASIELMSARAAASFLSSRTARRLPPLKLQRPAVGNVAFTECTSRRGARKATITSVLEIPRKGDYEAAPIIQLEEPPPHLPAVDAGDRRTWRVLPDIWAHLSTSHADRVALVDPHRGQQEGMTYGQLHEAILNFAEGLQFLGLQQGDSASLFSDNSHRWLVADQATIGLGAINAVRGSKCAASELMHILSHSDSSVLIVESMEALQRLEPLLEASETRHRIKFAVVLWPPSGSDDDAGGVRMAGNIAMPSPPLPPSATMCEHAALSFSPPSDSDGGAASPSARLATESSRWFPVYSYQAVMATGQTSRLATGTHQLADLWSRPIRSDDIATIVYTSGTTGHPKGVMLTHANLMHQVQNLEILLKPQAGDVMLSLLPPWHIYERTCEYFLLSHATRLVYSGVKTFKEDLALHKPDFFVAVPLVFEILHSGVQKKLSQASAVRRAIAAALMALSAAHCAALREFNGWSIAHARSQAQAASAAAAAKSSSVLLFARALASWLLAGIVAALLLPMHALAGKLVYSKVKAAVNINKVAVSGGGSLPRHVDEFFEQIGITLLNGYGLTETAPVLAVRRTVHNPLGSVGLPVPGTAIKIVDPLTGDHLPDGERGLVKAKGPQVMKGYYKDPAATAKVIDNEGWFSTGDLGWIAPSGTAMAGRKCGGVLVLDGRAKDTIVLANGENVEPSFVEEAALRSPLIRQIMVFGQDQRKLAALVVVQEEEVLAAVEAVRAQQGKAGTGEASRMEKHDVIRTELHDRLVEAGCLPHERVGPFAIVDDPFSVDNGLLTMTMKMRRDVIYDHHRATCEGLFK